MNDQVNPVPSIEELQKEIRALKRKLSLTEIACTRVTMLTASQDRVETIWNNSLKRELEFFKLVLENTTSILFLLDFDGRFAYASDIFLRKAGILNFGLINGRHFRDVLQPLLSEEILTRFSDAVDKANAGKNTVSLEEQIDFSGWGYPSIFSILITPMIGEYDKSTGTMALFNDITEIKEALTAANQANHAKTAFLAKMSHEIRTPMNAIIGMTELVMRVDIPAVVREHILTIRQAGMNLLSIIDDILDFSKIETGKLELVPKEYNFSSLVNDVISIINTKVLESRLRFMVYIDNSIPNTLFGDEARIRQIMLNLLSNAVKYTERGYISLSITGGMKNSSTVILIIKVTDTGKGIRQEDMDKLFDEFTRFDLLRNTSIQGTGLGLPIAQNLVKAMNGKIDVQSSYGEGSAFTVTLPQEVRKSDKLAVVENAREKRTLIFERRELFANSIKSTMENLGVECEIVSTEEDFFRGVMSRKFPFIFVASVVYDKIKAKYREFKSDAKFLLIAEFGEIITEPNISVITTPVFSIPVAKFLNGISDSNTGLKKKKSMKFTAPEAKVLLVDDLNTNLKVAEGLMRPYNMQISVCNSGLKAIEMIQSEHFDIVFMDHMMPEMDGIETTVRIRELGRENAYLRDLPIIALTANAVSGTREMFLENSFNDFLPKPIDKAVLDSVLEKWLPKEKQLECPVESSLASNGSSSRRNIDIKGLFTEKGLAMAGGSVKNYINTLAVFHKDGTRAVRDARFCLEKGDIKPYTAHMHALKSALAIIGCDWLSEAAGTLEAAGKKDDTVYIRLHSDKFLSEMETLLVNIYSGLLEENGG